MIYFSFFILALLMYALIRTVVNEIKKHITKEIDRLLQQHKDEYNQ